MEGFIIIVRKTKFYLPGTTFSFTKEYQHCFRVVFADYFTPKSIVLIEKVDMKAREHLLK